MPIIFNGQTYNSAADMPPDARQAYERAMSMLADTNKDGMPDDLETLPGAASPNSRVPNVMGSTHFSINGMPVQGLDDLPPETRQQIEQAMRSMDADGNGVPDFLEKMPFLMQMLPAESRQAIQQAMAAYRTGSPNFPQSPPAAPAMSAGMPAPIPEPPMLAMAPQIPMPSKPMSMPPMATNIPDDPDAGRRRLVMVLVALLVLMVLGAAAVGVVYVVFFLRAGG
jgi:hypothetical protein